MLGLAVGNKSTRISHKRFCNLLVPVKMHWNFLLKILTSVSVKVAAHPASQHFSIYHGLADVMLLETLTVVDYFGRYGMPSWALSTEIISAPLGQISLNAGAFDV